MPAVSVIMPAYNVEPYIGDGDRVRARRRPSTDFELLVVDDGSTDGTARSPPRTARAATARPSRAARPIAGCRRRATRRCGRRAARSSRCSTATTSGSRVSSRSRWRSFATRPEVSTSSPATVVSRQLARRPAGAALSRSAAGTRRSLTILGDEMAGLHHVGLPPAASTRASARSTKRCARTRTTTSGCARRSPGSSLPATISRSGSTGAATTASRRATCACCAASCRCLRKLRPLFAGRPANWPILDRQMHRFEIAAASPREARAAIEDRDFETAATSTSPRCTPAAAARSLASRG